MFDLKGDLKPETFELSKALLKEVGAPEEIVESSFYQSALVVIQAPSSASNLKVFFEGSPAMLQHLDKLKPIFCTVFRENSLRLRRSFFRDPLIQHMWALFRDEEQASIKEYISTLRK